MTNPHQRLCCSHRSKDYKKVPIAKLDEKPLLGSDVIVETLLRQPFVQEKLEKKWEGSSTNMQEFAESDRSQKWTKFATDELASLLYPNICRTLGDSYRAFAYVEMTDSFGTLEKLSIRGLGSLAMYMAASRVKSKFQKHYSRTGNLACDSRIWFFFFNFNFQRNETLPMNELPFIKPWSTWKRTASETTISCRDSPSPTWVTLHCLVLFVRLKAYPLTERL